jgi:Dehydrogenases with different specificities (related to short-chain alcohol dehydrogenases)
MGKSVALVTGGLGGIGTEISKKLSENGYTVVATTFDKEVEKADEWVAAQKEEGFNFLVEEADVTSFDDCAAMVQRVEDHVGPIDVLVNCAGITRDGFFKKHGRV